MNSSKYNEYKAKAQKFDKLLDFAYQQHKRADTIELDDSYEVSVCKVQCHTDAGGDAVKFEFRRKDWRLSACRSTPNDEVDKAEA